MAEARKYNDPFYDELDNASATRVGIDPALLRSIRLNGEKSNSDQVSSAGARTSWQITPTTRKLIESKYGIDPWLNEKNASLGAAYLLKESLDRNKGDAAAATREYVGGTNPENHGPVTRAYEKRVIGGLPALKQQDAGTEFDRWLASRPSPARQAAETAVAAVTGSGDAQAQPASVAPKDVGADFDAWQKAQQPKELPLGQDIARGLGLGTRAAINTVGNVAGYVYDPLAATLNAVVPGSEIPTARTHAENVSNALNLPKPETPGEKLRTAVQEFAGENILTAGAGGVTSTAKAAPKIVQEVGSALAANPVKQIASSAGAGAASELAKQAGAGTLGQVVAGLAGGAAPGAISGIVESARNAPARAIAAADEAARAAAARGAEAVPGATEIAEAARKAATSNLGKNRAMQTLATGSAPNEATVAAAKRLGIEDALQPDHVTTNQAYRELSQAVKSAPGSALRSQEIEGLNRVAERADRIISDFGGSRDVSTVSQNVRRELQNTQKTLDSQADAMYAKLREQIPAQDRVPAENVLTAIKKRAEDLGGEKNLSAMEKKILSRLGGKENPTYANLDDVRRDLTAARVQNKGAFKDSDSGLIKFLEGKLKQDQGAYLTSKGFKDDFDLAQKTVAVRKGIEDDLTSLFGKQLGDNIVGDLSKGVLNLSKGDTTAFVNLIKSVPENMRQEVAASGLRYAFGKNAVNPESINFNTFSKWYNGLANNKQAYVALMSNLPRDARNQLRDLARVSDGIAKATRERITTGRIQAAKDELAGADTMLSNLYEVAKRAAVGIPAEAISSSIGLPGAGLASGIASALTKGKPDILSAADKVLTSPEYMKLIQSVASGVSPTKAEIQKVSNSRVMREFWRKLPTDVKDGIKATNPAVWVTNTVRESMSNNKPGTF